MDHARSRAVLDASLFVELIRPDGSPRMPTSKTPLPADKVALIERWVKEGASTTGSGDRSHWTAVLRKNTPIVIPAAHPVPVAITGARRSAPTIR